MDLCGCANGVTFFGFAGHVLHPIRRGIIMPAIKRAARPPDPGPEEWIGIVEMSRRTGLSRHQVRKLVRNGTMTSRRLPGLVPRIPASEASRVLADFTHVGRSPN
jgi:hypothetical protein